MKYFLHDSNSFSDEKVTELYINFGYEGLGLFYTILEKIASQEKPIKTHVLKKQLFVGKKLEKCWNFMEEIELIYSNNGETFNENILKFSEKYKIKKEKTKERVANWRENQAVKENVTCYNDVSNGSKVKEIEVKGNKDNKDLYVGLGDPTPTTDTLNYTKRCEKFIKQFNLIRILNSKPSEFRATKKVEASLKARLQKYQPDEIIAALKNAIKDPYHIESNLKYITPEFILREDKLERYLNQPEEKKAIVTQNRPALKIDHSTRSI